MKKPLPNSNTLLKPKTQDVFNGEAAGILVLAVRKGLDISQKTLALEMHFTPAYLCDLENGHRQWNKSLYEKAKAALDRLAKEKGPR